MIQQSNPPSMTPMTTRNVHEYICIDTTPLLEHASPICRATIPSEVQVIQSASQLVEHATASLQHTTSPDVRVNIPIEAMYNKNLATQLDQWVALRLPSEQRNIAKNRILTAAAWGHKTLSLASLNLESLPNCLGELTHLETLNLSCNHLTTLPASLCNLVQLKHLICNLNPIHKLPDDFEKLTQLESLFFFLHNMTRLPSGFSELKQLKTVDFRRNIENNVPAFASLPPNLKTFWENTPMATCETSSVVDRILQRGKKTNQDRYGHVAYTLF